MKCQNKFTVKKDQKVFLVVCSHFDCQAQFIIYFVYLKKKHTTTVSTSSSIAPEKFTVFSLFTSFNSLIIYFPVTISCSYSPNKILKYHDFPLP